jgi:hypothetical protein
MRPGRMALAGTAALAVGVAIGGWWLARVGVAVAYAGLGLLGLAAVVMIARGIREELPRETSIAATVAIEAGLLFLLVGFPLVLLVLATAGAYHAAPATTAAKAVPRVAGDVLAVLERGCYVAIPWLLIAIPESLRRRRKWKCASDLARALVPAWLAAGAAVATWTYVFLLHFFGGALAGPSLEAVAVGGLATAALLAPPYQFVARSFWQHGAVVVLDPVR